MQEDLKYLFHSILVMKRDRIFNGVFPAVITPFDEEENVDETRLKDFLDHVIEGDAHGIYLLGTNGEGPLLTLEEKKVVIETTLEHVNEVPVIVGSMCNSTKNAVEISRFADDKGADAVHVIVPYYYPITQKSLRVHLEDVSNEIDIPMFLYSIPQFTGNKIDTSTVIDLIDVDKLIGIKDSSGDVDFFYRTMKKVRKKREEFIFFGGDDSQIFNYLAMGGDGSVTAVGNVFPELVTEIYENYRSGDLKDAVKKQKKVIEIKDIFDRYPTMSAVKGALKLRGLNFGDLRKPMYSLNASELEKLEEELEEIGMI